MPHHPQVQDYQAIFDATPGNYLLLSPELTIVGVNQCYLTATNTRREEIVGRGLFDIFPDNPEDPKADGVRNLRASLNRVLASKRPDRMPLQKYDIRRPEAEGGGYEERYWSPLNSPVLDERGEILHIIHWVEDVSEFIRFKRQMLEEDLRQDQLIAGPGTFAAEVFLHGEAIEANRRLTEAARHYRFLADLVPQLIWTADAGGAVDYFNSRWFDFTGLDRDRLLLDGWHRLLHPADRIKTLESWTETIRTGAEKYQIQHRLFCHDGTYRWMLTTALPYRNGSGRILKWFGSTTDIHDKVMADERLQQAQRLQAAGQLAGGVAHEVNNMMTIVMGCGEFALQGLESGHPQRGEVEEMVKAAKRAAEVTRQLLAYSRQQVFEVAALNLNAIVTGLAPALTRLIGSDRQLTVGPARGEAWVRADRGQLEQVVINLVANARDATGTDGLISIDTGLADFDPDQHPQDYSEELQPGPFVRLSVRDDGVGMTPEVAARVFEPFFTTKAPGQGTGLGLSMVYGIVRQSGGFSEVTSTPGGGTVVAIYLPAAIEEPAAEAVVPARARGTGEQILVVEDDPQVRSITRRALQGAGYTVYEAMTGQAAIHFVASHSDQVDLIVSDVVMPGVNGRELTDHLRVAHPEVPVLLVSGYPGAELERRGLDPARTPFIQKPFTPEALVTAVHEALARRPRLPASSPAGG